MSDYSKLTNDDLDRLIAERRGWKEVEVTSAFQITVTKKVWINPNGFAENKPSFTTDPRYAMELLIELPIAERMQAVSVVADKLLRSISEKYAIWKGEK